MKKNMNIFNNLNKEKHLSTNNLLKGKSKCNLKKL